MTNQRVMIVEDNPTNMMLARDVLELDGFEVCCAINASEALEKIKTFLPAVILMDIQLPGIDGLKLTRQIKQNPSYINIAIIAISAYAMKNDKKKILAAGCSEYIAKPADMQDVIKLIKKYLLSSNV